MLKPDDLLVAENTIYWKMSENIDWKALLLFSSFYSKLNFLVVLK
jgi:hypothetical protein